MTERWLPVVGYEGLYEVSESGHIRRVGKCKTVPIGYVMKTIRLKDGHLRLHLCKPPKRYHDFYVDELVARAFLGPRPQSLIVRHKDGNLGNNHLSNLEYAPPESGFPGEEWLAVVGYEGLYEASSRGRVRRIAGSLNCNRTRVLKTRPNNGGYHLVALCKQGTIKMMTVHKIIALTFHGPLPTSDYEVNHKNTNKNDNRPDNLEYLTWADHYEHTKRNGRVPRGERCGNAKLTDAKVREIRSITGTMSDMRIGKLYGVSEMTINRIKNGSTWRHVP